MTSLVDAPGDAPRTVREKIAAHAADPTCNGCHQYMDPIGLGLEGFDAVGAYRTVDNGLPVDARSELDGVPFEGPRELGALLRDDPAVTDCIARRMYRHATGHLEGRGEFVAIEELRSQAAEAGYRVKAMVLALVENEGFRYAAEVAP